MFKQSTCLQKKIEHGGWGGFVYFTWPTVISLEESAQHTRLSLFVCSSGVHFPNVGVTACPLCRVRLDEEGVFKAALPVASKEHKSRYKVSANAAIVGKYGETVEVPCNRGNIKVEDIIIAKWKYNNEGGNSVDLLTKKNTQNASLAPVAEYQGRLVLTKDLNLKISQAKMADQRTFTCMVVAGEDIFEYPVDVTIEKAPSPPTITNQAKVLEVGKQTTVCHKLHALKFVLIPLKGMITASLSLLLLSKALLTRKKTSALQTENLSMAHYDHLLNPSEKVTLQVVAALPIKEGASVTLKCAADGNPPPTKYNFYIKGKKVTTDNSDNYTFPNVTRADSGEYKCSLVDNEAKEGSARFTVVYLDITNVTKGKIVKLLSESFEATLDVNPSERTQVSWSKDNVKLSGKPKFDKLKYSDTGVYECVVSLEGIVKKASFELSVRGAPIITQLTKLQRNGAKLLSCKAEGSPKPTVQWSINGTNVSESSFVNGAITYNLTFIPTANLTMNCTVSNELGTVTKSIDISTSEQTEDSKDKTQVVVGVVIGLIVAAVILGLAYWVYMKRTREGTWKTGEKENGTVEESKKLEETQKADV
ncbi:activated leukocyte cell adhesion molecule b isoform X2 [Tachysurus ichikawai]